MTFSPLDKQDNCGILGIMGTSKRVLVVDDEPSVTELVSEVMQEEGWSTYAAGTGTEALAAAKNGSFDLVILDLKMPELDGFEVCQRIRKFSQIPIIVLSGLKSLNDRERCLKLGVDDYITKPFDVDELRFRVKAISFRSGKITGTNKSYDYEDSYLKINFNRHKVIADGRELALSPMEFQLLYELVKYDEKLLTHEQLMTMLWGAGNDIDIDSLYVCVTSLRHKLERDPSHPQYIITQPRTGYYFRQQSSKSSYFINN